MKKIKKKPTKKSDFFSLLNTYEKEKKMNSEIKEIICQIKNIIDTRTKSSRLEILTDFIKKIKDLEHLFDDDQDKEYDCSDATKSKGFSHLQKCIVQTIKFNFLEEYIDLYLTENPEAINYQNEKGWSALMIASRNANFKSTFETVKILLKHGADVNHQSKSGKTALMFTSFNNYDCLKTFELLLEYGTNINLVDSDGYTALICFTVSKNPDRNKFIETLLKHQPDLNFTSKEGYTALSIAVNNYQYNSTKDIIEMIVRKMENCDIIINNTKLIKFLYEKGFSNDLINHTLDKGAKISDIFDQRTIELISHSEQLKEKSSS